jgi:surface antigen
MAPIDSGTEKYRIDRAFWLGLLGFLACIFLALCLAFLALIGFEEGEVVSQVVSPFLAVLGTLVGVFFGVQIGSAGREEATRQARDANYRANAFAAAADPKALQAAVDAYRQLSGK